MNNFFDCEANIGDELYGKTDWVNLNWIRSESCFAESIIKEKEWHCLCDRHYQHHPSEIANEKIIKHHLHWLAWGEERAIRRVNFLPEINRPKEDVSESNRKAMKDLEAVFFLNRYFLLAHSYIILTYFWWTFTFSIFFFVSMGSSLGNWLSDNTESWLRKNPPNNSKKHRQHIPEKVEGLIVAYYLHP